MFVFCLFRLVLDGYVGIVIWPEWSSFGQQAATKCLACLRCHGPLHGICSLAMNKVELIWSWLTLLVNLQSSLPAQQCVLFYYHVSC